jgi:ABC-type glycerol-3-phosphate transport system substrate-binding protein
MRPSTRTRVAAIAVGAIALTTAGCATTSSDAPSATCQNEIVNPDAPSVEVWSFYPNVDLVVDEFNNTHDDVQVCWVMAGAGADEYNKLNVAFESGTGAPDVVQLEYDQLPNFIVRDTLVDLAEHGADEVEGDYTVGAWSSVSTDDSVYAIPVDSGPMGMFYRQDLLDAAGIPVPTTWAEFATAAQQMKDSGSSALFTDWYTNFGYFTHALLAQGGWEPFDFDLSNPDEIGVDIDSEEGRAVLQYWFDLIDAGLIDTEDRGTTDYQAKLVNGGYATYIAAAWGQKNLLGVDSTDPAAVWRIAPLPQWNADQPVAANHGGGGSAVTNQAEDPELAAQVAIELFGTQEAWKLGIDEVKLFPTWTPVLESDEFLGSTQEFFGDEEANRDIWYPATTEFTGTTFGPVQSFVYDKMRTQLVAAIDGDVAPDEILANVQADVIAHLEEQGFTVK